MATNISRPLVIQDGAQKRLPDAQKLNVGTEGIVAWDDGYKKLEIGHADNLLKEDGSDPASNHIEFLGGAKFNRDVYIQGELRVAGQSVAVDTMVTQTIFEQSVVFGNEASDSVQIVGLANFDGSIDADVTAMNIRSSGVAVIGATDAADIPQDAMTFANANSLVLFGKTSLHGVSPTIDLDGSGGISLDSSAGAVNLTALNSSTYQVTGAAQNLKLDAVGAGSKIWLNGAALDLDAASSISADAGSASYLKVGNYSDSKTYFANIDNEDLGLFAQTKLFLGSDGDMSAHTKGDLRMEADDQVFVQAGTYTDQSALELNAGADALVMSAQGKAFLASTDDLRMASADKVFVQAGAYAGQTALESALTGDELVMTSQTKAYLAAGSAIDALAPAISESASNGNFVMRASTTATAAASLADAATLGQVHLASTNKMVLDSKAALEIEADAASHIKVADGTLLIDAEGVDAADRLDMHAGGIARLRAGAAGIFSAATEQAGQVQIRAQHALRGFSSQYIDFASGEYQHLSANGASSWVMLGSEADVTTVKASPIASLSDPFLALLDDATSYLQSAATEDLELRTHSGDLRIIAQAALNVDTNTGGDLLIEAKHLADGKPGSGGELRIIAGDNNLTDGVSGFLFLSSGVKEADRESLASGDIVVQARNALRLHADTADMSMVAGGDLKVALGTGKHFIMQKSDGSAPNLDAPADAAFHIRNVKDPEKDQDVVTKKYMEENGGGTAKLTIAPGEVGTVAVDDLVSLNSDGQVIQASGAAAATARHYAIGFVTKIENSNEALVRMLGKYELAANHNITAGQPVYMAGTSGDIVAAASAPSTEGSMVQRVGFSLGGKLVLVAIGEPVIL